MPCSAVASAGSGRSSAGRIRRNHAARIARRAAAATANVLIFIVRREVSFHSNWRVYRPLAPSLVSWARAVSAQSQGRVSRSSRTRSFAEQRDEPLKTFAEDAGFGEQ